jgi:transcriptional regulator with XRE-family HTH domain
VADSTDRRALARHLAARLRELRARRDLTQDQVAAAIGCHESAVSRWESGERLPTLQDLVALCRLLEVSCDDLLGRAEQPVIRGMVLLDRELLDRLAEARSTAEFDALVAAREQQAAWLPVPDRAVLVPVEEAMRRARLVADRFPDSRFADRLFRPRA